ncbi:MAG: hypothetical protein ACK5NK_08975 [Niabella sp.]
MFHKKFLSVDYGANLHAEQLPVKQIPISGNLKSVSGSKKMVNDKK